MTGIDARRSQSILHGQRTLCASQQRTSSYDNHRLDYARGLWSAKDSRTKRIKSLYGILTCPAIFPIHHSLKLFSLIVQLLIIQSLQLPLPAISQLFHLLKLPVKFMAALTHAKWLKAWGKLPIASPLMATSSEKMPRWLAKESTLSKWAIAVLRISEP